MANLNTTVPSAHTNHTVNNTENRKIRHRIAQQKYRQRLADKIDNIDRLEHRLDEIEVRLQERLDKVEDCLEALQAMENRSYASGIVFHNSKDNSYSTRASVPPLHYFDGTFANKPQSIANWPSLGWDHIFNNENYRATPNVMTHEQDSIGLEQNLQIEPQTNNAGDNISTAIHKRGENGAAMVRDKNLNLKPYVCSVKSCAGKRFSRRTYLIRHEREIHGMHDQETQHFLCPEENCGRARIGFECQRNLKEHIKRMHK